jgi:hypothetical protein
MASFTLTGLDPWDPRPGIDMLEVAQNRKARLIRDSKLLPRKAKKRMQRMAKAIGFRTLREVHRIYGNSTHENCRGWSQSARERFIRAAMRWMRKPPWTVRP